MAASARMWHGTTSAAIRILPGDSCEVIANYAATDLIAAYSESYSLLDSITILTTRSCSSRGYPQGRAMRIIFRTKGLSSHHGPACTGDSRRVAGLQ